MSSFTPFQSTEVGAVYVIKQRTNMRSQISRSVRRHLLGTSFFSLPPTMLFRSVKSAMPTDPAVGIGKPSHVLRGPYGYKLHRSAKTPQGRQAGNWQAKTVTKVSGRLS